MSALERVARRIGMTLEHLPGLRTGDTRLVWADKGLLVCEEDELRTYLLTGDRPLRMVAAYTMGLLPAESGGWIALDHSAERRLETTKMTLHPTPEEAIIALAERIEGEGRE